MLKKIAGLFSISIFLIACNSNRSSFPKFLNKDSLPSQLFTINNEKDTLLNTLNGAIIKIAKGSFSTENVKLEVKEAYTIPQMILAGLTTQSGGKPLSSGGMIYINSVDKDVSIKKPLNVSIPTNSFDDKMQLYKGEEKDGKIDWVDPEPIEPHPIDEELVTGKTIFQNNCASCHALDKVLIGPALRGVEDRGPWHCSHLLNEFTRNTIAFIPRTEYTRDLQKQYGQIMPSFPGLTDRDLEAIYYYIKNENSGGAEIESEINSPQCEDSCRVYDSLRSIFYGVRQKREDLIIDNGDRINFEKNTITNFQFDSGGFVPPAPVEVEKVTPIKYHSIYYQINIKTFGWNNVDFPVVDEEKQAELKVEIQGEFKNDMSVFIVVPSYKIFAEGGPLSGEENAFGFYTMDGKISMPNGLKVIVFAVGEANGELVYDAKEFLSTDKQRIILTPIITSKANFNFAVKNFGLDNASVTAVDSKNANEIRKGDKEIKKGDDILERYRPKKCICDCGEVPAVDSTKTAMK
jgi:mono/diheme cytochrome c family protein